MSNNGHERDTENTEESQRAQRKVRNGHDSGTQQQARRHATTRSAAESWMRGNGGESTGNRRFEVMLAALPSFPRSDSINTSISVSVCSVLFSVPSVSRFVATG